MILSYEIYLVNCEGCCLGTRTSVAQPTKRLYASASEYFQGTITLRNTTFRKNHTPLCYQKRYYYNEVLKIQ